MYLDNYQSTLTDLCKQNRVKSLYVFGSVLTDQFNDESDIDLIVDIDENDPLVYSEHYFGLKFALQDLLNRPIDLLESRALRNPYLKEHIDNTKQLVYAN
jgi:predicted nucleotidyltransferase